MFRNRRLGCGKFNSLRGFTLIELLVVITVVGVLIAFRCRPCKRRAIRRGGFNALTI
jgi:prepilin-type N-terminal cleavage/methylation domain-containing protein